MKGQPYGTNIVFKIRKIPYKITEELEAGHKINGRGTKKYEEIIWQEKKKPSRIEGWRQCVVRKQEYLFKSTLKETGPEKVWTF